MSCLRHEGIHEPEIVNTEFLEGMRDMWAKNYQDTAFLRDIPRLIKRTQVQTSDFMFHGPFVEESTVDVIFTILTLVSADIGVNVDTIHEIKNTIGR